MLFKRKKKNSVCFPDKVTNRPSHQKYTRPSLEEDIENAESKAKKIMEIGCVTIPTDKFLFIENYLYDTYEEEGEVIEDYRDLLVFEDSRFSLKLEVIRHYRKTISVYINGDLVFFSNEGDLKLKILNKFIEKYDYLLIEEQKVLLNKKKEEEIKEMEKRELINKFIRS